PTSLATLLAAKIVLVVELNRVPDELAGLPVELPVEVVDRQRDAVLAVQAERGDAARDGEQRADPDRCSGGVRHAAELDGLAVNPAASPASALFLGTGRGHQ